MSDGIEWVDEPPFAVHRKAQAEFAKKLRAYPGRWAIYPMASSKESARAAASRISRGRIAAFAEGFEAVTRRGVVYVRYTGV